MKKFTLFSIVAVFAATLAGCSTANTGNGNVKVNGANVNSNTAVVVNSNTVPVTNTNTMTGNANRYSSNITREEYERNKATYDADRAGSTIGQGANDSWLWFKTKAALTAVDDLRDSTINVDVANDVVTLRGTVANKAQADKAIAAAKAIDGVKNVNSVLKVQPADSMTNQMTSDGAKTGNANAANANRR